MSSQPSSPPPYLNPNLQRSLQYYQKGVLQPEAWFRIVEHDYTQLIAAIDWQKVFHKQGADFSVAGYCLWNGTFSKNAPTPITHNPSHSIRLS